MATPYDDGDWYDLVFDKVDYGVEFYLNLARNSEGPVLDVACGTGRILIPCLQAGIDVEGIDLAPGMLDRLRRRTAELGLTSRVKEADMRLFQLNRTYALVMIPFNAFVHNLTTDDQLSCLERCREHLAPGGSLVLDAFFPGSGVIAAPDHGRVLELELTHPVTGMPIRMFDTRSFDRVLQLQRSLIEIEILDPMGNLVEVNRSETVIRWIYKFEMELLLRLAGFSRWAIYGGFDLRQLEKEDDGMVVMAWK